MDHHGIGEDGPDHQGMDDHNLADHGLDQHATDHGVPDHHGVPADDFGGAGPGWPDELGAGHLEPVDADLASADTAELSFAEDYAPGDGPVDQPIADDQPYELLDLAGAADPAFGVDPDLYPLAEVEPVPDPPFPPPLEVDPPEPVDGHPWTDPAVLGHEPLSALGEVTGGPDPAELYEYAGEQPPADGDPWAGLLSSADPATSALARWWAGQG